MDRDYGPDFNLLLWRTGVIYIHSPKSYAKLFVSKYYTPPYFVEVYTNRNLKKQKNQTLTFEMSDKSSLGRFILTGGYIKVKNSIMINTSDFSYYNASDTLKYKFFSVDYRKSSGSFVLDAGYFHVEVNNKRYKTAPSTGGVLRGSYKSEEFSGFLELIYRGSYRFSSKKIDEGYELNGGFRIKILEDSYLELKGYNILNTAQKIPAFKDSDFKYYLEDRRFVLTFIRNFDMFRLIYVFMLFYLVFAFASEEQIHRVEAEIISKICSAISKKDIGIKVYLTENMKYIIKYSKIFVPVDSCEDADIVVAGQEIHNCRGKIMVVTRYFLLKRYKNAVAAFYWYKGRPNITFVKEKLERYHISLPEKFSKFVDSERNL
ncbi:MAG: hypothetical protein Q9M89_03460 [Persephonella sp.]|nr:hypothetical protein [Persephonella sp.]